MSKPAMTEKPMKNIIAVCIAVALSACTGKPIETTRTDNTDFSVDFLFEKDGCYVYRFYDAGNYRYFSRCPGALKSEVSARVGCGKGCTTEQAIPTN